MESCYIKLEGCGLTTDDVLTVAAVLGEANIKSADQYLAELKLLQLESGISWTDVLERQLVMAKRALKRDVGPEHRAKEVRVCDIPEDVWETKVKAKGVPHRTTWAFAWVSVWMLRCIELAQLRVSDVTLNFEEKLVTLFIKKSKMDQAAHGVKRTLKCCGAQVCGRMCPWLLAQRVLGRPYSGQWDLAPVS